MRWARAGPGCAGMVVADPASLRAIFAWPTLPGLLRAARRGRPSQRSVANCVGSTRRAVSRAFAASWKKPRRSSSSARIRARRATTSRVGRGRSRLGREDFMVRCWHGPLARGDPRTRRVSHILNLRRSLLLDSSHRHHQDVDGVGGARPFTLDPRSLAARIRCGCRTARSGRSVDAWGMAVDRAVGSRVHQRSGPRSVPNGHAVVHGAGPGYPRPSGRVR